MSRKRKRRNRRPGNIKNNPLYDPFPKAGLVKQYEPYIRKVVGQFAKAIRDILLARLAISGGRVGACCRKDIQARAGT